MGDKRLTRAFLLLSIFLLGGCLEQENKPKPVVKRTSPKPTKTIKITKTTSVAPKAKRTTSREPVEGQPFVNGQGMKMVWIPAGSFKMGQGTDHDAERPIHSVKLSYGFWMSSTETTQEQYKKVMGSNPAKIQGKNHPVESVDWPTAGRFCSKLQVLEFRQRLVPRTHVYKLPSEAQWEYCARAGTETVRYAEPVDDIAWHEGNASKTHHPVAQKNANSFGLYDMLGNVGEWCADGFHRSYQGAPKDGSTWTKGMVPGDYITRGGHYDANGHFCSAYFRRFFHQYRAKLPYLGFRVVLVPRKR